MENGYKENIAILRRLHFRLIVFDIDTISSSDLRKISQ